MLEMIEMPRLRSATAEAVRERALGRYGTATWVERLLAIYAETGQRRDWHHPRADVPPPPLQNR